MDGGDRMTGFAPSRRGFLAGAAGAALLPWAARDARAGAFGPSGPTPDPGDAAWRDLARELSGPVVRRADFDSAKFAQLFNRRYANVRPNGIAFCNSVEDVQKTIKWVVKHGVRFVGRSGGHSYAGYSTTEGLVLDVSAMNAGGFDRATGIATVQAGSRNGQVYALLEAANASITHGRCPTVGVAGFLLGGGIGFNMRARGVAVDQIQSIEMVDAKGELRKMSAQENSDLFWANRGGGGGNFGVATNFTLKTFPVTTMTAFKLVWEAKTPDPRYLLLKFAALMPSMTAAPDGFGSRIALQVKRVNGANVIRIDLVGQYTGTRAQVEEILAPAGPPTTEAWVESGPYWTAQHFLEDDDKFGYFQERSAFLTRDLPFEAIATAFNYLGTWPGTGPGDGAGADLRFFQTGGQMNRVRSDATAFVHRDSVWLLDIGLNWAATDTQTTINRNLDWQAGFYDAMLPYSNRQAYQNFTDPSLKDYEGAYYGANRLRLSQIKKQVDPNNLFQFAQSITPV
ncbi:MAG: FAD-binding oxidoreductase [Tagaea sp.]|nr:FAD-binding oxidoreductase [Tagaea sp.]